VLGFLFIIVFQTAYFFFYSKFSFKASFLWALLDWSIWFLLFLPVFYHEKIGRIHKKFILGKTLLVLVISITFPLLHAAIGLFIYAIFIELDGPYFESLVDLVSRRWFLNMLISAVLTLVFAYVRKTLQSNPLVKNSLEDNPQIIFKDGIELYQLAPEEIQWISTAKNYVIIETTGKQILIRMTLNAAFDKINEYGFIKISRSMIVNKNLIKMITKKSQYSQMVEMKSGQNFPIGRTYLKSVMQLMTR
jgi:hypothetical protein